MTNYPIFIIDGPDGTGKTTQAILWGQYFTLKGKKVSYFSFPVYEFPIGKAIGRCLGRWGEKEKMPLPSPEAMAVLYALNRLETLPYILSSIIMGDLIILNRGPYANLYNVARMVLEDKINWETLSQDEKANKINLILRLDNEFLEAISKEREVVNIFLSLETKESIELAKQKALSTLGGEPDEYERKHELQALVLQLYEEVARGEIPGHKAELVMATRGSIRRIWEGDVSISSWRNEWSGVSATAAEIFKVIFSHLFYNSDREFVLRELDNSIAKIARWIDDNSVVEGGVVFEFRKRWNLSAGLNPDLFGKRPLLAEEIQRSKPEVWEILQTSFARDKEGLETNIKQERE